jgi:hypothetical protein
MLVATKCHGLWCTPTARHITLHHTTPTAKSTGIGLRASGGTCTRLCSRKLASTSSSLDTRITIWYVRVLLLLVYLYRSSFPVVVGCKGLSDDVRTVTSFLQVLRQHGTRWCSCCVECVRSPSSIPAVVWLLVVCLLGLFCSTNVVR